MREKVKRPMYDEKIRSIIEQLSNGKTREKLAQEMGYTTYKTIDMYFRRRNFLWDSAKQNYIPAENTDALYDPEDCVPSTSKAYAVYSLFEKSKPSADPKAIAKLAGFKDHLEMANYMKGKNYRWDNEKQNYVPFSGEIVPVKEDEEENDSIARCAPKSPVPSSFDDYLPILELLEKNRDRLLDIILPGNETSTVPRYIVPGISTTKSVHMSSSLDRLVREFSNEKNISQRDIFEIALIDFFSRYGYKREVSVLLNRG